MSAKSILICNDIISVLVGNPVPATPTLALSINIEALDLSTLHVFVTPLTVDTEWANRSQRFKTFSIAVSVFQHVTNVENEFPDLIEIVEQIDTYLTAESAKVLTGGAHLVETNSTVYDYTLAEENSLFLGVVTAQYRVVV